MSLYLFAGQAGDVTNQSAFVALIEKVAPYFLYYLAAPPIVKTSFEQLSEALSTHVLGIVSILDAL